MSAELRYAVTAQKDPRRYPGSRPTRASDGMIFEADDRIRLKVTGSQDGQLYIIYEGPVGTNGLPQIIFLFPNTTSNNGSAELKADQPIQIPAATDNPDQDWLVFDEGDGTERLWLVWSVQTIAELEALKGKANPRERGVISEPFKVKSITEYLSAHSPIDTDSKIIEANGETTISTPADVAVGVVMLERRRTKR